jgi:hypothetical protein
MSNTNTTTMTSPTNTCTKCNGSGNLGFRRANGVCFRCNGTGLLGKTNETASFDIAAIRRLPATHYAAPAAAESAASDNWLDELFTA